MELNVKQHRIMNNVCRVLVFVALNLLCAGCWPLRITTSPGASGVLVDAQTHSPISGAKVVVCYPLPSWNYADKRASLEGQLTNARPPQVISDGDGRFLIPPEYQWIIYYPSPMSAPAAGDLVIRRDGYDPEMIGLWTDGIAKVGTILLKPIAK